MPKDSQFAPALAELSKKPYVLGVYLFGSRASGKAKPYSDADLCVVTSTPPTTLQREEILSLASKKVDLSIFWDLPPRIRFSILKTGVLLFSRQPLRLQRASVRALLEYLDVRPMVRRFLG